MTPLELQRIRSGLKNHIRSFFDRMGYLEVETPILVIQPGTEVYLDYFQTNWHDYRGEGHSLALRSSPELHMKQLLSAGAKKIYQFAPSFRNSGELSRWHHPEFLMLEWYEAEQSFEGMIAQTESLLRSANDYLSRWRPQSSKFLFPEKLSKFTVHEAFSRFAGIDLVDHDPHLATTARQRGYHSVLPNDDFETAFFKLMIDAIEPAIEACGAAVLYDYPQSQAALAQVKDGVAKRFEVYLGRVELCNGFLELSSLEANKQRIESANQRRRDIGREPTAIDPHFLEAMAGNFPPCCGNALGIDRMLATFLGWHEIDGIIPFRHSSPFGRRPD